MKPIFKKSFLALTFIALSGCSLVNNNHSEYKLNFKKGVNDGCLKSNSSLAFKNKTKFCSCLSEKYMKFKDEDLQAIERLVEKVGNDGANLVNLTMIPDQKSCYKKYVN